MGHSYDMAGAGVNVRRYDLRDGVGIARPLLVPRLFMAPELCPVIDGPFLGFLLVFSDDKGESCRSRDLIRVPADFPRFVSDP